MGKYSEEAAFMVFHKRCLWLWAQNHKQRLWKTINVPSWRGAFKTFFGRQMVYHQWVFWGACVK